MENQSRPKPLTSKDFFQLDECHCGKSLFRYHNISKNEYIAKCATAPEEYDIKLKKWVNSKKQPCKCFYAYYAERPVFKDITPKIKKNRQLRQNKDQLLEDQLKSLFNFVFISNHSATLDEINIIVRLNLRREPLRSLETLLQYQSRIFSEKIIDLSHLQDPVEQFNPVVYLSHPFLVRNKMVKKKSTKLKTKSSFIVVSDDESNNTACDNDSEPDTESLRELSDYEDTESVCQQTDQEETFEEAEEQIDDYDDAGDFSDYD
jgi:hypothetical protein